MEERVDPNFGTRASYQTTLGKWSLADLTKIPRQTRSALVEGVDYSVDWNELERLQMLGSPYQEDLAELIGETDDSGPMPQQRRPLVARRSSSK
jgi:hypothetical protein